MNCDDRPQTIGRSYGSGRLPDVDSRDRCTGRGGLRRADKPETLRCRRAPGNAQIVCAFAEVAIGGTFLVEMWGVDGPRWITLTVAGKSSSFPICSLLIIPTYVETDHSSRWLRDRNLRTEG